MDILKIKINYALWFVLIFLITSCDYDNYDAPQSKFYGHIAYQGKSINVGYDNVSFQLYQSGFGKKTPINVTVAQDGSFSALLFNGNYKLVFPRGQGPFDMKNNPQTNTDTVLVNIKRNTEKNIEVIPYYTLQNVQFSINISRTVTTKFRLNQVVKNNELKDYEYIALYISKTKFVDQRTSINSKILNSNQIMNTDDISISADIPELTPQQNYIFVRIGVKIKGVEDMLFSEIKKLHIN